MSSDKELTMTADVKIETLSFSQWQEYKELRLRALETEPQAFLSSYEEEAAYPDGKWQQRLEQAGKGKSWIFFARSLNGKLVGMIGGYRDDNDLKNHSAQIWGVYVDRQMRGRGIAKALMARMLEELESDPDVNMAILEVNTDQESAKGLYESFGFQVKTTYSEKLGDGREHQISKLEKSLSN